jgi:hypothetical protein
MKDCISITVPTVLAVIIWAVLLQAGFEYAKKVLGLAGLRRQRLVEVGGLMVANLPERVQERMERGQRHLWRVEIFCWSDLVREMIFLVSPSKPDFESQSSKSKALENTTALSCSRSRLSYFVASFWRLFHSSLMSLIFTMIGHVRAKK